MPWCPVCKNEYRDGIARCAECKAELVDRLEDESGQAAELERQKRLAHMQAALAASQEAGEEEEIPAPPPVYHAYQNSAAKAEDNRTSAYTLLFVGIVGFILVILVFVGVIPIYHGVSTTKYLICGVMGTMFVLFIVFGVVSMRNSRILLIKAESEDSLLSEMTRWCEEHLSAEQVDEGLSAEDAWEEMAEEQKYFRRADKMKTIIGDKFMNLDEALLEHFVDEYYQELFEKQ